MNMKKENNFNDGHPCNFFYCSKGDLTRREHRKVNMNSDHVND